MGGSHAGWLGPALDCSDGHCGGGGWQRGWEGNLLMLLSLNQAGRDAWVEGEK